jgi:putative transposase
LEATKRWIRCRLAIVVPYTPGVSQVDTSGKIAYSNTMPYRTIPLVTGEYYHVYNRGVAYQPIFNKTRDYERMLQGIQYYQYNNVPIRFSKVLQRQQKERDEIFFTLQKQNDKIVDIVAYCLMPNHFHFLIKQNVDDGLSRFLRLMINSYVKYFNTKYKRAGTLFQGMFKVVHIETEDQLLHLSRYIHLNPVVAYLVKDKDFMSYPWSSHQEYLSNKATISNPQVILDHFSKKQSYEQFVLDQVDYGKELEKIKHLRLD